MLNHTDSSARNLADAQSDKLNHSFRSITVEQAAALVEGIMDGDGGDEQALALIALIAGIAYESDFVRRDQLAMAALHKAYSLTTSFERAFDRFHHSGRKG